MQKMFAQGGIHPNDTLCMVLDSLMQCTVKKNVYTEAYPKRNTVMATIVETLWEKCVFEV